MREHLEIINSKTQLLSSFFTEIWGEILLLPTQQEAVVWLPLHQASWPVDAVIIIWNLQNCLTAGHWKNRRAVKNIRKSAGMGEILYIWNADKISLWSILDQHVLFDSLCSGRLCPCKEIGWEFASPALTRSLADYRDQNFSALHNSGNYNNVKPLLRS